MGTWTLRVFQAQFALELQGELAKATRGLHSAVDSSIKLRLMILI